MNMKEAFISVLTHWKNFHGRASRSEFWYFILASFLLGGIVVLVWCMLPAKEDENKWGRNPLLEK